MKGIILAGGRGSRLYPCTLVMSKQLQPVYDKPMIYYPLTTLIEMGIREIMIITTREDSLAFKTLLGNGKRWGIKIEYAIQSKPDGLAQAFTIAKNFIGDDDVTLILGDNIFSSSKPMADALVFFRDGVCIFGYEVEDPSRYGVIEWNDKGEVIQLVEKPSTYVSSYAIPGIYICDNTVVDRASKVKKSARGEYEIVDVLRSYCNDKLCKGIKLPRGFAWLDAGTSSSLHESASYVQMIEHRTGIKLGCPEEASFNNGWLSRDQFVNYYKSLPYSEYRQYLERVENYV